MASFPESLEDEISDALTDSLDMDWTGSVGARAVIQMLEREGYVVTKPNPAAVRIDSQPDCTFAYCPNDPTCAEGVCRFPQAA